MVIPIESYGRESLICTNKSTNGNYVFEVIQKNTFKIWILFVLNIRITRLYQYKINLNVFYDGDDKR